MSGGLDSADFARIAADLHEAPDPERTLELVIEHACHAITCDRAGLVLSHKPGQLESAATTDAWVNKIDQLQGEHGEGPALWAMQHQATVLVDVIGVDPRWPQWAPAAADLGLRCVVSVRLFSGARTLGALNLYATQSGAFDEDDVAVAEIFARHASIAIATTGEEAGLRYAIDARHLVGLAQGMLMERHGLDADRAFAVLRRLSRDNNIKLRAVASQVITTGLLSKGS
ncbi:GAF and ANTAR domain-containing protein [Jiangella alkaliphila]|uniref:GAF domain-containing protein n=1 Tax=Jiangella alkaliphila TaxID=419479 RepID=A0A1H2LGR5_9ACTN|nr:GAF and ANTAR domain-containing protein [Jiangella alkaliphila]SDU79771.1 GAF domain-containing protein [Jiangella alkaliphila]